MTTTWQSGVRTLRTEAVGIVRLLVIDPFDTDAILYDADTGDELAAAALHAVGRTTTPPSNPAA